jgi:integrase
LTPAEFRALLRCSDALFRQVLLVFRYTGVRPAEFCGLTWEQVHWDAHCWVIRKHKTSSRMKEPKPRVILMPPLVEALLRWRLRRYGQTERVFLNERGRPWTTNALRCRMRRARKKAGIAPDQNGEQVVMYTARHTYATWAVASGVADRRLADLLGHTNTKTTQRYIHLPTDDLYRASLEATRGYISPK